MKRPILIIVISIISLVVLFLALFPVKKHFWPSTGSKSPEERCRIAAQSSEGLTEAEATKRADDLGLDSRVVKRDGENFAIIQNFSNERLNYEIEAGIVKSASCY